MVCPEAKLPAAPPPLATCIVQVHGFGKVAWPPTLSVLVAVKSVEVGVGVGAGVMVGAGVGLGVGVGNMPAITAPR
jgi:hypothetical protein